MPESSREFSVDAASEGLPLRAVLEIAVVVVVVTALVLEEELESCFAPTSDTVTVVSL